MSDQYLVGQVLHGINNIYTVDTGEKILQCRIKGKVLKTENTVYNPIAVGDYVRLQPDQISDSTGWIVERRERSSSLIRWNKKRNAVQVMAANVDLVVCVGSVQSPPFRPRFIDRVLVCAEHADIQPLIVLNKCDLAVSLKIRERMRNYKNIGYRVVFTSAVNGRGLAALRRAIRKRTAVFFGQSGVGKSSLLNRLFPDLDLPIGDISIKYDRGTHTTSFARLLKISGGYAIIDTPGIRELEIAGIDPRELGFCFPEFVPFASKCSYPRCQHRDEPECSVRQAVENGRIHSDRYESYLRIHNDLEAFMEAFHGSPYS